MATWWLTEAVPPSVTALLPVALFPLLGVTTLRQATAPYSSELIFLFLGGFVPGLAMERWGLHRRIALRTILLVGTAPRRIVAGFMLATAALSMWVSNTATAVMMLPIGLSVVGLVAPGTGRAAEAGVPDRDAANFATCLMLAIAYGASVGGIATLVGSPPNIVLAGFVREMYGQEIGFRRWFAVFPVRLGGLPGGRRRIASELEVLGRMGRGERAVLLVFAATALAWIFRPRIVQAAGLYAVGPDGRTVERLTDSGIAVTAAVLLFLPPDPGRFPLRHVRHGLGDGGEAPVGDRGCAAFPACTVGYATTGMPEGGVASAARD